MDLNVTGVQLVDVNMSFTSPPQSPALPQQAKTVLPASAAPAQPGAPAAAPSGANVTQDDQDLLNGEARTPLLLTQRLMCCGCRGAMSVAGGHSVVFSFPYHLFSRVLVLFFSPPPFFLGGGGDEECKYAHARCSAVQDSTVQYANSGVPANGRACRR